MSNTLNLPENLSGLNLISEVPQEYQLLVIQALQASWNTGLLVTMNRHYSETVTALDRMDGLDESERLKRERRANSLNEFPYTFANTVFSVIEASSGEKLDRGKEPVAELWNKLVHIATMTSPRTGQDLTEALEALKENVGESQE